MSNGWMWFINEAPSSISPADCIWARAPGSECGASGGVPQAIRKPPGQQTGGQRGRLSVLFQKEIPGTIAEVEVAHSSRSAMMITRRLARQASAFSQSTPWTCPSCVRRPRVPLASFPSTDQSQSRPEPSLPPREQPLPPHPAASYPPLAPSSAETPRNLPIKTASPLTAFPICSPPRASKSLGSTISS